MTNAIDLPPAKRIFLSDWEIESIIHGSRRHIERCIIPQPTSIDDHGNPIPYTGSGDDLEANNALYRRKRYRQGSCNCSYAKPGDHLYSVEAFSQIGGLVPTGCGSDLVWKDKLRTLYRAHTDDVSVMNRMDAAIRPKWKTAASQPEYLARAHLLVRTVKAVRLHECYPDNRQQSFSKLFLEEVYLHATVDDLAASWDRTRASADTRSNSYVWASNPWVWRIDFSVLQARSL